MDASAITELQIGSETEVLRQVVLHQPGREIEYMSPSNHDALLFDDILVLEMAKKEHQDFQNALKALNVTVLLAEDLLEAALPKDLGTPIEVKWGEPIPSDFHDQPWDIERLLWEVVSLNHTVMTREHNDRWLPRYSNQLYEQLRDVWEQGKQGKGEGLARTLIQGLEATETMASYYEDLSPFLMAPVPNFLFMRDSSAVIGSKVLVSRMAKPARRREGLLMSLIFQRAFGGLANATERRWFDSLTIDRRDEDRHDLDFTTVEGGDILVLRNNILAVGLSERTSIEMLHTLGKKLLWRERDHVDSMEESPIEVIYAVLMPKQRVTMHLDTIFTMLSEDECLIYPPMIDPTGIERVRVVRLTRAGTGKRFEIEEQSSLVDALKADFKDDLTPISCGGPDAIHQEREQWTDGANVLALAPGVVVGYDRNEHTARALENNGYHRVRAADVYEGSSLAMEIAATMAASVHENRSDRRKYVIEIPGAELSRARGGPRCMTLPVVRGMRFRSA